jgi:hypothetical protein
MEAISSSETSVLIRVTRPNITEDAILYRSVDFSRNPEILNFNCLENLSRYGTGPQRKHLFLKVLVSILSVSTRNELVSREVNICYSGHMPQQAGYQGISVLFAA